MYKKRTLPTSIKVAGSLAILLTIISCNIPPSSEVESEKSEVPQQDLDVASVSTENTGTAEETPPPAVTYSDEKSLEANIQRDNQPVLIVPIQVLEPENQQSEEVHPETTESITGSELVRSLCTDLGNKLGSVEISDCLSHNLQHSGFSVLGRSLAYKDFAPTEQREPLGRVMVVGGIHGDEFSSVSVVFKWMDVLNEHHSGLFHWRFIPSANPDGLVQRKSQRQNAHGVDLNRNFPTNDWYELALKYWRDETHSNARRYPGQEPNSEPETIWLTEQIEQFDPDVIISMHAPYHLVDYDGPPTAPNQLGSLYLRQLGVYPGSMGNYIGVDKKMPIVTVELESAGIMPSETELSKMWNDLIRWLRSQLSDSSRAENESENTKGEESGIIAG